MLQIKQDLLAALAAELDKLAPGSADKAVFESPKVAAHGDFACTAAMVMVEFVSANPTGPLHVGHGRQAALGDALCNLLRRRAGSRSPASSITTTPACRSHAGAVHAVHAQGPTSPATSGWPESAYNGDYIADIAADFLAKKTVKADDREFTASGDPDDLDGIRQFAVAYLRHEQDLDLQAFGVRFDNYYLESSLYTSGRVEQHGAAPGRRRQDLRARRRPVAALHRLR
jgi:arginyl-tRNA synthetase